MIRPSRTAALLALLLAAPLAAALPSYPQVRQEFRPSDTLVVDREGALLRGLQRHRLPAWAAEIGCRSWAQVVLKFIVSHPAVTCAIPATRRVDHVRENLAACRGPLPDAALRRRIAAHIADL